MTRVGIELGNLGGLIDGDVVGTCLRLCVLYIVFTHLRLGILEMSLCVYLWVFQEGMYTCKTGNFSNEPLCLYLDCCRKYLHI